MLPSILLVELVQGNYRLRMRMEDDKNQELTCISFNFRIALGESDSVAESWMLEKYNKYSTSDVWTIVCIYLPFMPLLLFLRRAFTVICLYLYEDTTFYF